MSGPSANASHCTRVSVHRSNELCQAYEDAVRETRACETSERENCCVPHYDESHEGGESLPNLAAYCTPD